MCLRSCPHDSHMGQQLLVMGQILFLRSYACLSNRVLVQNKAQKGHLP